MKKLFTKNVQEPLMKRDKTIVCRGNETLWEDFSSQYMKHSKKLVEIVKKLRGLMKKKYPSHQQPPQTQMILLEEILTSWVMQQ